MTKIVITYSALILSLMIFFQLMMSSLTYSADKKELYLAITAAAFLLLGLMLGGKSYKKLISLGESSDLTQREVEILQLIAEGHTNREIAEHFFISLNTVKTHIQNIYSKLGVKRRTQAVLKAKKEKIILLGD